MKSGWKTEPLGELCEVFDDGDWIESKDQSSEGIRLIQTGNVGEGIFKDRGEKARYIAEMTFKRLRCTEIFEGDCLVSRLPDPVGRSCILPDTGERMITAVDCTIIRFKPNQLLPAFFNFYSQSDDYLGTVAKECTGTTRNRISRSNLGLTPIPVPPLAEQQRIVGILDEAFAGIATAKANAEKNLQNARALFESYLQSVFTERGKGWVEKKMGGLATFRNGINYTKDSKGERIKIVGVSNFQKHFSAPLDDLATVTIDGQLGELDALRRDDILAVRSNGNIELIGRTILVGEVTEKISHSGFTIRIPVSGNEVLPRYLCHFMKSASSRKRLTDGGTGTNIKSLNQGMLSDLAIPFPPAPVQKVIVQKIEKLSDETQRLASLYERKLAALDALKKSLLHQTFTGEL
jgi:type I restriction enzyme S subunit